LWRGDPDANGRLTLLDHDQKNRSVSIDVLGESIGAATLAPDGLHALATCRGNLAWIDLQSEKTVILTTLSRGAWITATACTNDGLLFAAGDLDGRIDVCDPERGTSIVLSPGGAAVISDLRFSRDATRLVSAQCDGSVNVWDIVTATRLREFTRHDGAATAAEMLPDGHRVISAGLDGTVRIREIDSGRETWREEGGAAGLMALAVSSDGAAVAWGGCDGIISVWDLEHDRTLCEIDSPSSAVWHLAFSPDGETLAATGNERTIRRYKTRTGAEVPGIDTETGIPSDRR
jgi:WD40 repeat protein